MRDVYPSVQSCRKPIISTLVDNFLKYNFSFAKISLQLKGRQYISSQRYTQEKSFQFDIMSRLSHAILCNTFCIFAYPEETCENSFADLGGLLDSAIVADKTWQK